MGAWQEEDLPTRFLAISIYCSAPVQEAEVRYDFISNDPNDAVKYSVLATGNLNLVVWFKKQK